MKTCIHSALHGKDWTSLPKATRVQTTPGKCPALPPPHPPQHNRARPCRCRSQTFSRVPLSWCTPHLPSPTCTAMMKDVTLSPPSLQTSGFGFLVSQKCISLCNEGFMHCNPARIFLSMWFSPDSSCWGIDILRHLRNHHTNAQASRSWNVRFWLQFLTLLTHAFPIDPSAGAPASVPIETPASRAVFVTEAPASGPQRGTLLDLFLLPSWSKIEVKWTFYTGHRAWC